MAELAVFEKIDITPQDSVDLKYNILGVGGPLALVEKLF